MKRSLFIAAISTLAAGSALAQSNVTIYGRLNDTVERQKVGSTSRTGVVDSASRIGFKGSEDLGGGLKANFVIEHGFNTDTGTIAGSRFWGRESTVGLSHPTFGAIRLGNMPASEAYFATADYVSMHNHDTGSSADALYEFVTTGALQNAIAYTTPTIAGFRGDVQYSLHETGTVTNRSFAVNYDAGPLHLGFGHEAATGTERKSYAFRALYELGAFTFGGYYERTTGDTFKRNNIRFAGMYAMGASEFHVNAGLAGDRGGVDASGAKQYTLGYNYNLSKRTKVYAFYTKVDNEANAAYNPGALIGPGPAAGENIQSFAVGVRHNF
ncbi:porin [Piscinibacter sp. HJYY11]|nr:porin [Piscinibacter sp. HJYY11]MBL0730946.1 porin [Piscinibacter sp. HJYY11]